MFFSKNAFLESIKVDPSSTVIHEVNGHKTTIFPGCKGPKTNTWKQTKKMANELNEAGIDVVFLSEPDGVICSDSILKIGNTYRTNGGSNNRTHYNRGLWQTNTIPGA